MSNEKRSLYVLALSKWLENQRRKRRGWTKLEEPRKLPPKRL